MCNRGFVTELQNAKSCNRTRITGRAVTYLKTSDLAIQFVTVCNRKTRQGYNVSALLIKYLRSICNLVTVKIRYSIEKRDSIYYRLIFINVRYGKRIIYKYKRMVTVTTVTNRFN